MGSYIPKVTAAIIIICGLCGLYWFFKVRFNFTFTLHTYHLFKQKQFALNF